MQYANIRNRVYYGSGERRWLAPKPSNESMFSQFTSSLRRDGSHSRSPSYEQYTTDINNPRRRPHETHRRRSESDSMEIRPHPFATIARSIKKQTSSIWSPHLRQDRRASRYSLWSPPSLADSAEFGTLQRNLQLVLFVFGFLCPFGELLQCHLKLIARRLTCTNCSVDGRCRLASPSKA